MLPEASLLKAEQNVQPNQASEPDSPGTNLPGKLGTFLCTGRVTTDCHTTTAAEVRHGHRTDSRGPAPLCLGQRADPSGWVVQCSGDKWAQQTNQSTSPRGSQGGRGAGQGRSSVIIEIRQFNTEVLQNRQHLKATPYKRSPLL